MLERDIEQVFQKGVKALGGRAFKVQVTVKGMPDRVVALPGNRWFPVELKTTTGRRSAAQRHYHARFLADTGIEVVVLRGTDEVRAWLKQLEDAL